MSENTFLLVPLRLDALRVDAPIRIAGALADFSKLPYVGRDRDVGAERAYISEDIVTAPFADGQVLAPGLHLHWALPDALTRSHDTRHKKDDRISFPAVPTIWRITRVIGQDETTAKSWLLESDYMFPPGEGAESGAICYPLDGGRSGDTDKIAEGEPPYRYLGRVTDLTEAVLADASDTFKEVTKEPLTAMGYGEPTFAAFYPNCRSVFGFRDPSPPPPGTSADYYVVGWYRDAQDDFCADASTEEIFRNRSISRAGGGPYPGQPDNKRENKTTKCLSDRGRAFSEVFGWRIEDAVEDVPQRSAYFARLSLGHDETDAAPDPAPDVSVALGNSATEALSAFLASTQVENRAICEDRLEALHLMGELDHLRIDTGAKFREARHARGFTSVPAGTLWQVSEKPHVSPTANVRKIAEEVTLDYQLAHALNRLNTAQLDADRLAEHVESHRLAAFTDWYKYMLCKYPPEDQAQLYPDLDEARYFLQTNGLPDIVRMEGLKDAADKKAAEAREEFERLVEATGNADRLVLKQIAAPRYWRPNEPVILLTGKDVKPMDRHGAAGDIPCRVREIASQDKPVDDAALRALIRDEWTDTQSEGPDGPGLRRMRANPWNPLLMEWEAQVWPLLSGPGKLDQKLASYPPDFITSQYRIHHDRMDLTVEDADAETALNPQVYQGRSILTPQAKPLLLQQIDDYLHTHLHAFFKATCTLWPGSPAAITDPEGIHEAFAALDPARRMLLRFLDETGVPPEDRTLDYLDDHGPEIRSWYGQSGAQSCDDFILSILTFRHVIDEEFHVLTQAMSGFNAALLAQKQTLQLPVADPLAFPDQDGLSSYGAFADDVAAKVQDRFNRYAPMPMLAFCPIRSGRMQLTQLRLIDTFGRHAIVPEGRLQTSAISRTLHAGDPETLGPGTALLPPRLVQPVRLGFRWLAGGHGRDHEDRDRREDIEANAHPATSPVCGWLVPNLLDGSLQVFDTDGAALGYLDLNGTWRRPPGRPGVAQDAQPNTHMQRVVNWLAWSGGPEKGILPSFLSAMEKALENVDPVNWAQHESVALLMGRPVAVVRAELRLEMRGRPAHDPDWELYGRALRHGRDPKLESRLIEAVDIPIRIGEHDQLNDGLIGFWKESVVDADGHYELPDTLLSPQAHSRDPIASSDGRIVHVAPHVGHHIGEDEALSFTLRLHQPPQKLTMLVDPRAKVHASCGIVPTKAIDIPPDQYRHALKAIEVSFLASPTLAIIRAPKDGLAAINMPLPKVPDYEWRWIENTVHGWRTAPAIGSISTEADLSQMSELRDGYLVLSRQPDTIKDPTDTQKLPGNGADPERMHP